MKNKFYKNLFQTICFIISLLFIYAIVFVAGLVGNIKESVVLILLISFIIPNVLFFSLGFYWIFQKVIISETGIQIVFIKKIIKECSWDEIESIEEANIMKNPAIKIKLLNGSEIHLDKRKQIRNAIEFYSKKQIIK